MHGRRLGLLAVVCVAAIAATSASECQSNRPNAHHLKGRLEGGAECTMLRSEGRLFALAGGLGAFKPGDSVCVRGRFTEVSVCMAGEGTFSVQSIDRASTCP